MKIILVIYVVAIIGAFILSHRIVYGGYVKKDEVDFFLEKHLAEYKVNDYASSPMFVYWNLSRMPYISTARSLTTKWYIEDHGTIPRWSKWNRILNEKYQKEKVLPHKKTLKDY